MSTVEQSCVNKDDGKVEDEKVEDVNEKVKDVNEKVKDLEAQIKKLENQIEQHKCGTSFMPHNCWKCGTYNGGDKIYNDSRIYIF